MFNELKELLSKSHSPYSGFKVASIVIDLNGNKYSGVNVETSTFTPTICAERNAIFSAMTNGLEWGQIKEVHILGLSKKNDLESFTTPCGVCRQVILESSDGKASVFVYNNLGETKKYSIDELLIDGFTGKEI